MTEVSENAYLVRVRAQVMSRDEGTGGWVALGGGGLADVMVGKRERQHHSESNSDTTNGGRAPTHEFFIHGKRISDDMVVLECTIKKDFQYNKVMPTFHHWVTEEKRFGLTFQTAADARAFDRGVRTAVDQMLQGLGGSWCNVYKNKETSAERDDEDEHNIFECLNLPSDSRSSSENSTASRVRRLDDVQTPILSAITQPKLGDPLKAYEILDEKATADEKESGPYVHLAPVTKVIHVYGFKGLDPSGCSEKSSPNTKPPLLERDSDSLKKGITVAPSLSKKKIIELSFEPKLKCRYCERLYVESENSTAWCDSAPDPVLKAFNNISCLRCAQCLNYHCCTVEDEAHHDACDCAPPSRACSNRWFGLTMLSLLVPCLWCYWPLRCLHRTVCPKPKHVPITLLR